MDSLVAIGVRDDHDVVTARQTGRELAATIGMAPADQTLVATAISELASNIVTYAGTGHIEIAIVRDGDRSGLRIVAADRGPGIRDVDRALEDGFSTGGRLGVGLPGVRRLVDEFTIASTPGEGTTVTAVKWT